MAPVAGVAPRADGSGAVWVVAGAAADTVARIGSSGTVTDRVAVDAGVDALTVVDGVVYAAHGDTLTAVQGAGRAAAGPAVAEATGGTWATADGSRLVVERDDEPDGSIVADGPVEAMAVWYGAVWAAAGG